MTWRDAADDAALVRASQQGDQEAFSLLVSRHASSILSVTTRMLGPAADAEDVAQETFVAAYKALAGFQLDAKFSTWLYRIAVNKCTDVLRARKPGTVSLDDTHEDGAARWEPADEADTALVARARRAGLGARQEHSGAAAPLS